MNKTSNKKDKVIGQKMLEKYLENEYFHFDSNTILYRYQYGFHKNHFTSMAQLHLTDKVTSACGE